MPTPASAPLAEDDARAELVRRLSDREYRFRTLYKIQDEHGNIVPFVMNDVQRELDSSLWYRNDILKSRQRGITTWACIRALDSVLFRSNTSAGIIAHTKDDALKFFRQKVLFAYDHLPEWLKAERPLTRKDMNGELGFSNDSRITVGTSLRSGTYQFVHVSELGPMAARYPQRAIETVQGSFNAVPEDGILVVESTAEGAFGPYYDLTQRALRTDRLVRAGQGTLTQLDYRFFFMPWWSDPTNVLNEPVFIPPALADYFEKIEGECGMRLTDGQRAWYCKKSDEQGEGMWSQFPSTPEEAFKASVQGSYWGQLIARAEIEGRVGKVPFYPGIPVNTFWDIGRNDTTCIWFHQQVGAWHHFIDFYEHSGEGAAHYAEVIQKKAAEFGYVYGKHYLPHDAEVTDWSTGDNKSRAELLEGLKVKPLVVVPRIENVIDGIEMVRQSLPRCRFDANRCGENPPGSGRGGLPSLRAYRRDWNDRGQCWMNTPFHDWSSNGADAFRQFAQGYKSKVEQPTTVPIARQEHAKRERARSRGGNTARWRLT